MENPVVVFENVSKIYQVGEVAIPALKGISLSIPKGRFSMVLGPSGSGKTTLLNLVGCLDQPTEGEIRVCGEKVAEIADDRISEFRARNIGFIFQNFNLIPVLSARENVEYPLTLLGMKAGERHERSMAILKSVGLADHARHRPNQLSGGQKQRVAIARALVKGPSLVLADEPTANLDSKTGAAIIDLMHEVQEEFGASFIFSTHDPQLISHAQDVFTIRDGELIEHRSEA
ncbi:MAG TPA: ABC transporter ATP-binding protein [Geobacteraceae bacterium]